MQIHLLIVHPITLLESGIWVQPLHLELEGDRAKAFTYFAMPG